MFKKFMSLLLSFLLLVENMIAAVPQVEERQGWYFQDKDTSVSGTPSNLRYFKFYDLMPDEITLKIFDQQDLSAISNKRLFVGVGVVDPKGKDCQLFKKELTGAENDITVCLPWWRIERKYMVDNSLYASGINDFLKEIRKVKPPVVVKTCKEYEQDKSYPGGKVTCTSYYDKNASASCWENPMQRACYVDNCADNIKKECSFIETVVGEETTLDSAIINNASTVTQQSTKVELQTHQYNCPGGTLTTFSNCLEEEVNLMFPFECSVDNPETIENEDEVIYCDENKPVIEGGTTVGYLGKCSDGRDVTCKINSFETSKVVCKEPIYETEKETTVYETELTRTFTTKYIDVLSGEPDIYSENPMCLRSNDVEGARNQELYVKIVGSGSLDDDIYVLRHKEDGSHTKVYCNMQHNELGGNKKPYNGEVLQCIDNDGSYSFNQTVKIDYTDIVSVQQNSENENVNGTPFAIGRNHYGSTSLSIDGILVAPKTFGSDYPYYPQGGNYLKTWDNTNSTLSILFPFAGAYELFFYNKNNKEMAKATLDIDDFRAIGLEGAQQVMLGKSMELAPGMEDDVIDETGNIIKLNAARTDTWVEWGGGVYGGRQSQDGRPTSKPKDSYVKENAVTNIIVKDLLTGAITPIPLTYPMAYPNRFFVSKLKVYEYREYRCYDEFETPQVFADSKITHVCTADQIYQDYDMGYRNDIEGLTEWIDDSLCKQNCRDYSGCSEKSETIGGVSVNGFSCDARAGENLGGDLSGTLFSSQSACEEKCFTQNICTQYTDNKCILSEEKENSPITDFTGKTLFRKKSMAYTCNKEYQKQIGCNKYDIVVTTGDLEYNVEAPGYETKDFSGDFEKAMTHANIIEVGTQHIWSGWQGKCVEGMKWNFSYLSDPMTIISYVMSAISSVDWLADQGVGWASSMKESWNGFTDDVGSYFSSESGSGAGLTTTTEGAGSELGNAANNTSDAGASQGATDSMNNMDKTISNGSTAAENLAKIQEAEEAVAQQVMEKSGNSGLWGSAKAALKDWTKGAIDWDNPVVGAVGEAGQKLTWYTITEGDLVLMGIQSAFIIAAPDEQDYILADKLLKGYYGVNDDQDDMNAYNSCMASIGASLPNLIGWSSGSDSASDELKRPWEKPLRMTPLQLAAISKVTPQNYVQSRYLIDTEPTSSNNSILMNVRAISADAYVKATQTICMGIKVSQAAEHIQNDDGGGGGGGFALDAMGIITMVIGMYCPPCALVLKIVMDLFTNVFAKVDTCDNEEDAMQWDILHLKTQKFMKFDQCVLKEEYCDKEASWFGSKKCVRDGYDWCCYDQITTRIFAEGIKAQLGKGWDSCNDITVNDLKDISFNACKPGQNPQADKCFPTDKYSEFQQALFRQAAKGIDMQGLSEQVINSMALDTE